MKRSKFTYSTSLVVAGFAAILSANGAEFTTVVGDGNGQLRLGEQTVAEYVWNDGVVRRPYLRHLRTPSGIQVTRNHPPVAGQDVDDHPTMHPGVWLAFGDLGGIDFWRNKGLVRHVKFIEEPTANSFAVRNAYEADGRMVCTEDCRIRFTPQPAGYLLTWDSTFTATDGEFDFGDQEEMGFGVRVHTPLAVVKGGEIVDAEGRKNGADVWGKQSDWCRYSGLIDGRHVGVVLMPDPANFRTSWFHARDYGLLVANPFGRRAFEKRGEPSRVVVAMGDSLRLRFGLLLFDVAPGEPVPAEAVYDDFLRARD